MKKCIEILHRDAGNISLDALADEVGLSRSRLSHALVSILAKSLTTYRSRCRLQAFDEARKKHPNHDLSSLAMACGFANYMQYYRTHRRLRGSPPSAQTENG